MLVVLDVLLQLGVRPERMDRSAQAAVVDQVHDADVHSFQCLFPPPPRKPIDQHAKTQTKPNSTLPPLPRQSQLSPP